MRKGLDTGKAFFQGILSKITDPEQRAAAETLLASDLVLTEIGNGVEGQAEIDRQLQAARTRQEELDALQGELTTRQGGLESWYTDLTKWHQENKDALEAAKKGAGVVKPNGSGAVVPPVGITDESFTERLTGERAAFLGFQRDQNQITREHFSKFSEIIDLEPLLKHPQIAHVGLLGVYELVHKDRLDAHQKAATAKAEELIRLDERQKVQASMATMPYPSVTGSGSGSPLDGLAGTAKDSVTDAAVAHYQRLQQEAAASTK